MKLAAPLAIALALRSRRARLGPVRQARRRRQVPPERAVRDVAALRPHRRDGQRPAPYDAKAANENAEIVADMAKLPWAGFVPAPTRSAQKAKPEIWTEQAKFKEHNEKLVGETGKLLAAAKTNNLDNLKTAFGSTAAPARPATTTSGTTDEGPRFSCSVIPAQAGIQKHKSPASRGFVVAGPPQALSASSFSINWCNSAKFGSPT
jgi:cytochrome c556